MSMSFKLLKSRGGLDKVELVGHAEMPDDLTVGDLKRINETLEGKGYKLVSNGQEKTKTEAEEMMDFLNSEGVVIRVDGVTATDQTPINAGSLVTVAARDKGGVQLMTVKMGRV